jgi:hypothetical protein
MFHSTHDGVAGKFIWLLQRACSKLEQRYWPLLLSAAGMERDHISLPMYVPASFVTALANVATPGDSLLQQASAGQPNQQVSKTSADFPKKRACRS